MASRLGRTLHNMQGNKVERKKQPKEIKPRQVKRLILKEGRRKEGRGKEGQRKGKRRSIVRIVTWTFCVRVYMTVWNAYPDLGRLVGAVHICIPLYHGKPVFGRCHCKILETIAL